VQDGIDLWADQKPCNTSPEGDRSCRDEPKCNHGTTDREAHSTIEHRNYSRCDHHSGDPDGATGEC
jgi:hypothetical protein